MSIKNENEFFCEICNHTWSRKYDYERHLKCAKHAKMRKESKEIRKESKEIRKESKEIRKTGKEIRKTGKEIRKMTAKNDIFQPIDDISQHTPSEKIIETRYCCDYCKFSTTNKKEANAHRVSKQHTKNENKEEDFLDIINRYVCLSCDKSYDKYISCWKHSKKCIVNELSENKEETSKKQENIIEKDVMTAEVFLDGTVATGYPLTIGHVQYQDEEQDVELNMVVKASDSELLKTSVFLESVVEKMMESNKNVIEKVFNLMEKMSETISRPQNAIIQTNTNTNTNSNNNTTNNHCTINMFLNEKCKDAINITDWVNNLVLDFEHLHFNADNGFQKGLTKMLIDNLKLYNIYMRPIHFTDIKRDTMYIKDADEWTKHDNHDKLIEVLETGARQGLECFAEWCEENTPAYHDLDSNAGKTYMRMHQNVIRPYVDRIKAYPKVVKELARATQLRKEDQQVT